MAVILRYCKACQMSTIAQNVVFNRDMMYLLMTVYLYKISKFEKYCCFVCLKIAYLMSSSGSLADVEYECIIYSYFCMISHGNRWQMLYFFWIKNCCTLDKTLPAQRLTALLWAAVVKSCSILMKPWKFMWEEKCRKVRRPKLQGL